MLAPLDALPEPQHIELDGAQVATYVLEPRGAVATGTPSSDVVLCHGTPWSAQVWSHVAHALAEGRRVLLWDMPGYGRSTMDADVPVDLASQMRRLAALLELWELDRPHVVAHDIGGAVALGAHLLHDAEYASLHLWDIVTLEPWGSPFFTLVADNVDVFAAVPARLHHALAREYVSGAALRPLDDGWLDALTAPWATDAGQAALYRQMAALGVAHTRPLVERLGSVRCATSVGWGEQDPWIPVEQAHRLAEALPGSPDVTVVDGAGHLVPVEAPQAVIAHLRERLD